MRLGLGLGLSIAAIALRFAAPLVPPGPSLATVTGTPKIGQTLTASLAEGAVDAVKWLAVPYGGDPASDGVEIAGANALAFTPGALALRKKHLVCAITSGGVTHYSAPTAKVRPVRRVAQGLTTPTYFTSSTPFVNLARVGFWQGFDNAQFTVAPSGALTSLTSGNVALLFQRPFPKGATGEKHLGVVVHRQGIAFALQNLTNVSAPINLSGDRVYVEGTYVWPAGNPDNASATGYPNLNVTGHFSGGTPLHFKVAEITARGQVTNADSVIPWRQDPYTVNFHSDYVAFLEENYDELRFMDWDDTNGNFWRALETTWDNRSQLQHHRVKRELKQASVVVGSVRYHACPEYRTGGLYGGPLHDPEQTANAPFMPLGHRGNELKVSHTAPAAQFKMAWLGQAMTVAVTPQVGDTLQQHVDRVMAWLGNEALAGANVDETTALQVTRNLLWYAELPAGTSGSTLVGSAPAASMTGGETTGNAGFIPVELTVELCNLTGCDGYWNLPISADDTYIDGFATTAATGLRPDLKTNVEDLNEVWNTIFGVRNEAFAAGLGLNSFGYKADQFLLARDTWLGERFEAVMSRVRGIMASHGRTSENDTFNAIFGGQQGSAGGPWPRALSQANAPQVLAQIDEFAHAPYYKVDGTHEYDVPPPLWASGVARAVDKLLLHANKIWVTIQAVPAGTTVEPGTTPGNAYFAELTFARWAQFEKASIDAHYTDALPDRAFANERGKRLRPYEFGPHSSMAHYAPGYVQEWWSNYGRSPEQEEVFAYAVLKSLMFYGGQQVDGAENVPFMQFGEAGPVLPHAQWQDRPWPEWPLTPAFLNLAPKLRVIRAVALGELVIPSPSPAIVDGFSGADGPLAGRATPQGQTWETVDGLTNVVVGGKVRVNPAANQQTCTTVIDTGWADMTVRLTLASGSPNFLWGLVACGDVFTTSANNSAYRGVVLTGYKSDGLTLFRLYVNGVLVRSGSDFDLDGAHVVSLVVRGMRITVRMDGVLLPGFSVGLDEDDRDLLGEKAGLQLYRGYGLEEGAPTEIDLWEALP